jgi:arylsulfatase A-like enzyme
LSVAAALGCGDAARPSVLLVTVDTLRADQLGAYAANAADTRTPVLDALATQSTLFERAAAPMPLTRPSHFSLLTSLYPREHGVLNNATALPDEIETLAEILQAAGYRTAAFTSVKLLGPESGAAQGFQHFDATGSQRERRAEDTVPRALSWLAEQDQSAPLFLWLHLFDPHLPYAPPGEFRGEGPGPDKLSWKSIEEEAQRHGGDVPRATLEAARRLYRGEIAYVDHWVGELLDAVDEPARGDDWVVVFTADHGECFEGGVYFEHADCLYQGAIQVPLLIRQRPGFAAGARVGEQVSLIDIAPTLLHALGLPRVPGHSGVALQERARLAGRHVVVQHPFYQPRAAARRSEKQRVIQSVAGRPTAGVLLDSERVGLLSSKWKYLRGGGQRELFRMAPVADEEHNRIDSDAQRASELDALLDRELAARPLVIADPGEINQELLKTLRALGYVD